MNDIDFAVIQTVTRFYRQHAELPRICLVHPSWFARLTIEKVYVHIPPAPTTPNAQERTPEHRARLLEQAYNLHSVPVGQLSLRSLPQGVRYNLPQEQWIFCLTRKDILRGLEMNEERHLLPGMSMASLMQMSEDERYWLTLKKSEQEVEREY